MKNSWYFPAGPTVSFNLHTLEQAFSWLLTPFFLLILILIQIKDVLVFASNYFFPSFQTHCPNLIPSSLSFSKKLLLNWSTTLILIILSCLAFARFSFIVGRTNSYQTSFSLTHSSPTPRVLNHPLSLPPEINLAPNPTVQLTTNEIIALSHEADSLSSLEISLLTQAEALNFALAFYYLGNTQKYHSWLEISALLDPNASYFTPP
jgi:hypothetical protein